MKIVWAYLSGIIRDGGYYVLWAWSPVLIFALLRPIVLSVRPDWSVSSFILLIIRGETFAGGAAAFFVARRESLKSPTPGGYAMIAFIAAIKAMVLNDLFGLFLYYGISGIVLRSGVAHSVGFIDASHRFLSMFWLTGILPCAVGGAGGALARWATSSEPGPAAARPVKRIPRVRVAAALLFMLAVVNLACVWYTMDANLAAARAETSGIWQSLLYFWVMVVSLGNAWAAGVSLFFCWLRGCIGMPLHRRLLLLVPVLGLVWLCLFV